MANSNKLFIVFCSGYYSMCFGWDSGWTNRSISEAVITNETERYIYAKYTILDREYCYELDKEFMERWGGYIDNLHDNAGSRSAEVFVYALTEEDADKKAEEVIMKFWKPSAYYYMENKK